MISKNNLSVSTEARMERIPIKRPSDIRQEQLQQISGVYYVEN